MRADEFEGLLRQARSIRRFDGSRPVGREGLLGLVAAARLAPTANNSQTLRFRLVFEPEEVAATFATHRWAAAIKDWDGPEPGERPTAYLAVCAPPEMAELPIRNVDAGIAAEAIALAASARGLGACMIKSYGPELDQVLGLGERGLACLLLVAVGWPAEEVRLEDADGVGGLAYWHDEERVNHVPKLSVEELLA